MVNKWSVSQLPSVSSLGALRRQEGRAAANQRAFIGYGDPVFGSNQPSSATRSGIRRNGGVTPINRISEAAPQSRIADLAALPDTAQEIDAIARVLGADPERDVFLRERATESNVKKADLAQYRVVMFATHGLVPGDIAGLTQPALALSAPRSGAVGGDDDDGMLTMDEILNLKLNARWVVLSACNTASNDGQAEESLSGLVRAFFYAGTRALLATHWPVETESARMLTTGLFETQARNPTLTGAQALRQTMLGLIKQTTPGTRQFHAHPLFWAPFALVGEGGN